MKIRLFAFNPDSILNNGFSRTVNAIILFVFILLPTCGDASARLNMYQILFIVIGTSIIANFCLNRVLKNTTFYEWDYTERKKKERFIFIYNFICIFLSSALCFYICITYKCFTSDRLQYMHNLKLISLIPPIFFIFNLFNIPSLYNLLDMLKIEYKIQKKPDNWQDEGEEITDEDLLREIRKNDLRYRYYQQN